jgi:hypothetical protein
MYHIAHLIKFVSSALDNKCGRTHFVLHYVTIVDIVRSDHGLPDPTRTSREGFGMGQNFLLN